eukprot:UN2105
MQQELSQQSVEQTVEEPVPMTREETVHVPKIMQQELIQQSIEQTVEEPVPMTREETVHAPKITQQARNQHFHVEAIVDVSVEQKVEIPTTTEMADPKVAELVECLSDCRDLGVCHGLQGAQVLHIWRAQLQARLRRLRGGT